MFEFLFVIAVVGVVGSAWWGWLRYGPLGVVPAGAAILLLLMLHYGGRLYVR
jgi:hypothetical protein